MYFVNRKKVFFHIYFGTWSKYTVFADGVQEASYLLISDSEIWWTDIRGVTYTDKQNIVIGKKL